MRNVLSASIDPMEQERTNWNDDRLDRLADQVDRLAGQVTALGKHMDERFDRLQIAMIITLGAILAAFGGALAAGQF
jgi:hypothetical protein